MASYERLLVLNYGREASRTAVANALAASNPWLRGLALHLDDGRLVGNS